MPFQYKVPQGMWVTSFFPPTDGIEHWGATDYRGSASLKKKTGERRGHGPRNCDGSLSGGSALQLHQMLLRTSLHLFVLAVTYCPCTALLPIRKTGWNQKVWPESQCCCVAHQRLVYFKGLSRNRKIPQPSFSDVLAAGAGVKSKKISSSSRERSTTAEILCKLHRKRKAKNHLWYIRSGRKQRREEVPLKREPTRLQVSTWSHEPQGKLLLACSNGR